MLLVDAKKCLTERQWEVIKGIFIEEKSQSCVADIIGLSPERTRQIKNRALRILRVKLTKSYNFGNSGQEKLYLGTTTGRY